MSAGGGCSQAASSPRRSSRSAAARSSCGGSAPAMPPRRSAPNARSTSDSTRWCAPSRGSRSWSAAIARRSAGLSAGTDDAAAAVRSGRRSAPGQRGGRPDRRHDLRPGDRRARVGGCAVRHPERAHRRARRRCSSRRRRSGCASSTCARSSTPKGRGSAPWRPSTSSLRRRRRRRSTPTDYTLRNRSRARVAADAVRRRRRSDATGRGGAARALRRTARRSVGGSGRARGGACALAPHLSRRGHRRGRRHGAAVHRAAARPPHRRDRTRLSCDRRWPRARSSAPAGCSLWAAFAVAARGSSATPVTLLIAGGTAAAAGQPPGRPRVAPARRAPAPPGAENAVGRSG